MTLEKFLYSEKKINWFTKQFGQNRELYPFKVYELSRKSDVSYYEYKTFESLFSAKAFKYVELVFMDQLNLRSSRKKYSFELN